MPNAEMKIWSFWKFLEMSLGEEDKKRELKDFNLKISFLVQLFSENLKNEISGFQIQKSYYSNKQEIEFSEYNTA